MSKEPTLSAPALRPKPWNDPAIRAIFYQAILLVAVVWFGMYLFNNTTENLERQGISTGFDFLETTAGFGIITHLIEYSESSSYGRAFLVGLLNTLLISFTGIIAATILGVIIGVARLSTNWLIARLAAVYIETFRNIPLLLQIFFWYFAVLRALPAPRNSVEFADSIFLNNRGIYMPSSIYEDGFSLVVAALVVAIVAAAAVAYANAADAVDAYDKLKIKIVKHGIKLIKEMAKIQSKEKLYQGVSHGAIADDSLSLQHF